MIKIKFNCKRPSLEDIASLICSQEFKNNFQEAVNSTKQTKRESLFYVAKEFSKGRGFISDICLGDKAKIDITHMYDKCYNAEEGQYTHYPLITVHTHPKIDFLCPSMADLYNLLGTSKDYAKREFYTVQPIAMISGLNDGAETLFVQDKANLLDSVCYGSIPWKGKTVDLTSQESISNLYTDLEKMLKNKTLTSDVAVKMLQKAGFAVSYFKGSHDKRKIKNALKGLNFIEKDRIRPEKEYSID
jgi:hypothetical protein